MTDKLDYFLPAALEIVFFYPGFFVSFSYIPLLGVGARGGIVFVCCGSSRAQWQVVSFDLNT